MEKLIKERKGIAIKAAQQVGEILINNFKKPIKIKSKKDKSLVTEIDLAAERKIVELIKSKYPQDNILSEENKKILYIPQGFAHGFCALENDVEILYKSSKEYSLQHEGGILWNDPDINIDWPIDKPVLSQKDLNWPLLKKADSNFIYEEKI